MSLDKDGTALLTRIGAAISIAWLGFILWALFPNLSLAEMSNLKPNEVGDLLAGVFSPLALIWFVIAYLLQREELKLQRRELSETRSTLENQRKEQARQADTLASNELHARRDTFFSLAGLDRKTVVGTNLYPTTGVRG